MSQRQDQTWLCAGEVVQRSVQLLADGASGGTATRGSLKVAGRLRRTEGNFAGYTEETASETSFQMCNTIGQARALRDSLRPWVKAQPRRDRILFSGHAEPGSDPGSGNLRLEVQFPLQVLQALLE